MVRVMVCSHVIRLVHLVIALRVTQRVTELVSHHRLLARHGGGHAVVERTVVAHDDVVLRGQCHLIANVFTCVRITVRDDWVWRVVNCLWSVKMW